MQSLQALPTVRNLRMDYLYEGEDIFILENLDNLEQLNGTKITKHIISGRDNPGLSNSRAKLYESTSKRSLKTKESNLDEKGLP